MTLDDAVKAVTAGEATIAADTNNLSTLQAAADQATAPLPGAKAQLQQDYAAQVTNLQNLITASQDALATVQGQLTPAPPPAG